MHILRASEENDQDSNPHPHQQDLAVWTGLHSRKEQKAVLEMEHEEVKQWRPLKLQNLPKNDSTVNFWGTTDAVCPYRTMVVFQRQVLCKSRSVAATAIIRIIHAPERQTHT